MAQGGEYHRSGIGIACIIMDNGSRMLIKTIFQTSRLSANGRYFSSDSICMACILGTDKGCCSRIEVIAPGPDGLVPDVAINVKRRIGEVSVARIDRNGIPLLLGTAGVSDIGEMGAFEGSLTDGYHTARDRNAGHPGVVEECMV